jgi:tagatose-6-phosphate ketose/aldose isomerase
MIKSSTSFLRATWPEIYAQPDIWRAWAEQFNIQTVKGWIKGQPFDEIWFCGAGTSAFIGDILVPCLEGHSETPLRAIATTDIVSQPQSSLDGKKTPLVVNFGRYGNSVETIGILDALDALAPNSPRLNITCNSGEGTLASKTLFGPHKPHPPAG